MGEGETERDREKKENIFWLQPSDKCHGLPCDHVTSDLSCVACDLPQYFLHNNYIIFTRICSNSQLLVLAYHAISAD